MKEFNLQSTTHQSIFVDSYVQTEQTSSETDGNNWNTQMSLLETPSDEQSLQMIKDKIDQIVIDRPELFSDASDHTIERLDQLISAIEKQAIQIEILHNDRDNLLERNRQLESDIQLNIDQKICNDNSTQTDVDQEEQNTKINKDDEPSLTNRLFGLISNVASSSRTNETVDNETQTDEQSQDKLTQVNNKLKRTLQTIKDKIHQAVIEQPQLFTDIGDDTIERLDHLISIVGNQVRQIDDLQNERDHAQHQINQLQR